MSNSSQKVVKISAAAEPDNRTDGDIERGGTKMSGSEPYLLEGQN